MSHALPAAAAAVAGVLVGATMVATRFVLDQTDPASLALLRYTVGFLCLLPPVLMAERVRFERRDIVPIALLGITQFGILIALLNFGLLYIPSGLAALIFSTLPFLTLLLAAGMGLEPLTLFKAAGVILTIVGVGIALADQLALPSTAGPMWIGVVAVFGSAMSGALCSVLYRPYLARYPVLQVSAFAMLASVFFLALLSAFEGFFNVLPDFTIGGWAAILFIGVSSGGGFYLWLWALRRTTPTRVAVFLSLSPVTAAGLGALTLAEDISTFFVLGLVCVALGLGLAHRTAPSSGPS